LETEATRPGDYHPVRAHPGWHISFEGTWEIFARSEREKDNEENLAVVDNYNSVIGTYASSAGRREALGLSVEFYGADSICCADLWVLHVG
jgi:hypothetical protein